MITEETIEKAKKQLSDPNYHPSLVAYMLLDDMNSDDKYFDLAWSLAHDDNCNKNDVLGLMWLLERNERRL